MTNNPQTSRDSDIRQSAHVESNADINLLDILIVVAKRKIIVFGLPLAVAIVAAVISFLIPSTYTGIARILPPQQNQSAAATLLGQLSGLTAVAGGTLALKNPSDLYVGMLRSRSVADLIIEEFKLRELYGVDTLDDARLELEGVTKISAAKDGIIAIAVDDYDPKRAADMANAYVWQLERLNERLALTEAAQRRLFFEKQLSQQKEALAFSEIELKKTQEQTGLIKLDEQGKAIIEAVAQVRAQIAAKEVQIGAMKSFTTDRNPERIRAEAELNGLRQQLAKLERNNVATETSTFLPTGKVPEVGLEFVRKLREVKYNETLFELLAKQYELARLDESKDASIIQILDKAVPPDRRTRPHRTVIVLIAGFVAGAIALLVAFLQESLERRRSDPAQVHRLRMLRSYLRLPARND